MGDLATPQFLIARWSELCRDPSLEDLPYKIELNAWGKVELTPRTNRRGLLVGKLAYELNRQLPGGAAAISSAVLTTAGIRVPDVVWASAELMATYADALLYPRAPELCIEVCTPDGEEKLSGYLAAGAEEVWLVFEDGSIRYFDGSGEKTGSGFPLVVTLPRPLDIRR